MVQDASAGSGGRAVQASIEQQCLVVFFYVVANFALPLICGIVAIPAFNEGLLFLGWRYFVVPTPVEVCVIQLIA